MAQLREGVWSAILTKHVSSIEPQHSVSFVLKPVNNPESGYVKLGTLHYQRVRPPAVAFTAGLFTFLGKTSRYEMQVVISLRPALFWDITQRMVAIPSRHQEIKFSWISWPWKMAPITYIETSVRNCQYTMRNFPEEGRSHLYRGGSLKSVISFLHLILLILIGLYITCSAISEISCFFFDVLLYIHTF